MSCYQNIYSYTLLKEGNWVLLFSDGAPWPNGKAHNLKVVILIGKRIQFQFLSEDQFCLLELLDL